MKADPLEARPPDVSVSIVSFNTSELLKKCLLSLKARIADGEADLEIIVADNGSTDGTIAMIESEFPDILLVETGGNVGYGRGNNAALQNASGKYFFVLNSDTEVEPGAIRAMIDFMDKNPRVGMVGAQLILPDQSIQRSCARDPTLAGIFWEQTYLDKLFPNNKYTGSYTYTGWSADSTREVQQVCGACFFVRAKVFRQLGGFDPAYFMYFEDTDFCVRLRRAGWPIFFLPAAKIQHRLGGSSNKDWRLRALMIASYNQSRYYFYRRNYGARTGRIVKALTVFGASLRLAIWTALIFVKPTALDHVKMFTNVLKKTLAMSETPLEANL